MSVFAVDLVVLVVLVVVVVVDVVVATAFITIVANSMLISTGHELHKVHQRGLQQRHRAQITRTR